MMEHENALAEAIGANLESRFTWREGVAAAEPIPGIIRFWIKRVMFAVVYDYFKHPPGILNMRSDPATVVAGR
jgi:hypothetical protein